jgi:electron transfer flavoprotein alpha subunit
MSSLLILAEQFEGEMRKVSFNAIGFGHEMAVKLGLDLHLLLIGNGIDGLGAKLAQYGAKTVHLVDHEVYKNYNTEAYTQAVTQVANAIDAQIVASAATVQAKDLMPRVAGRLGVGMAADIIEMCDDGTFKRPVWAGSAIARIRIETARKVITLRTTAFTAAEPTDAASAIQKVKINLDQEAIGKVKTTELELTKSDRPDLAEANVVVSGGRAMRDANGVALIEKLADIFNAAIGATRAACDAGLLPNDLQVGQTGKIVAPDLYFAIGISGAIQHLAGMKSSKVIVAINKDPEAPIFQVADYGIVGDMFKIMPELNEKIAAAKAS